MSAAARQGYAHTVAALQNVACSPGNSAVMVDFVQPSTKQRTPLTHTQLRLQCAGSKPLPLMVNVDIPAALIVRPAGDQLVTARVSKKTVRLPWANPLPATLSDTCATLSEQCSEGLYVSEVVQAGLGRFRH